MTILLLPILLFFCACAAKNYPEPDRLYQNQVIGYEFSYTETDDSVQIELRNIGAEMLDVETIGFYAIDGDSISVIDALAIKDTRLDPQAATIITFPMEGEGFVIMNSAGSFVVGDMFEVRYQ